MTARDGGKGQFLHVSSESIRVSRAVEAVLDELRRAEEKFPMWPRDVIHAAAIVAEESGELVQAALQNVYSNGRTLDHVRREAIQTAAMAIRLLSGMGEYR